MKSARGLGAVPPHDRERRASRGAGTRRPRGPQRGQLHAAILAELADVGRHLSVDELRVLVLVATRVWVGQTRYGCLALARDRRDLRHELLEEVADGLFYAAAALLRRRRRRRTSA